MASTGWDATGDALLEQARALNRARDYPALAQLLESAEAHVRTADPELPLLLADVWRRLGRADESLALAHALEPRLRRDGHDRLLRHQQNLLGMLLFEGGEIDAAERTWLALLDDAQRAGDSEWVARATQNLGVVYTLKDRARDAMTCHTRAIAAYQRLGHRRGLAQSHQNLAIAYRDAGYSDQADQHFREAATHARADGSQDELARVEQERALLLLLSGDVALARSTAQSALRAFTRLGDPNGAAEAWRVLGLAALAVADHDEARAAFTRALEPGGNRLLHAEVHAALAELERQQGRTAEAEASAAEAARTFGELGASGWGAREQDRIRQILESSS